MTAAEIAYEAYRANSPATEEEIGVALHAFRSRSGDVEVVIGHKLPPFAELEPRLKAAWSATADAVCTALCNAESVEQPAQIHFGVTRGGSGFGGSNL